jgi:hypothetical protein
LSVDLPAVLTPGLGLGPQELVGVSGHLAQFTTHFFGCLLGLLEPLGDTHSGFVPLPLVLDNDTPDQQPDYLTACPECLFALSLYLVDTLSKAHEPRLG